MNYAVTLKELRKAGACTKGYTKGYNKLVCRLSGKTFNPERETYIRFKYDEPISIKTILESNGFNDALWATRCVPGVDRDLRLFAVWCARQVQHLMGDERSINAIDTAERYANGEATDAELTAARDAARDAAQEAAWADAMEAARDTVWEDAWAAAWAATWHAGWAVAGESTKNAQREMFVRMLEGTAPWQVGEKK